MGQADGVRVDTLFSPLLDKGKVDVVISGHRHRPRVIVPKPELQRSQWPVYICGAHPYTNATAIRVEADVSRLNVQMIKTDGTILHENSWQK